VIAAMAVLGTAVVACCFRSAFAAKAFLERLASLLT
jgi:hypothetical protein